MSDKRWDKLLDADRRLRQMFPVGMRGGNTCETAHVDVKIEKITGFELFNTRPYHNYETWSTGYRVTVGDTVVEREDLDDALDLLERVLPKGAQP